MAELRHAVAAISGTTAHEFEALAETRRGRYAAKALGSGARRMQGDPPPEILQETASQQPQIAPSVAREAGGHRQGPMGLFGKRREPVPQVVLPDHATDALNGMQGDQSMARASLERLVGELMDFERIIACAENYKPWTSMTSMWVVTNRRLFEIRSRPQKDVRSVPLASITGISQGKRDIDFHIVLDVPNEECEGWSSHADGQLYFASHETSDAKRLYAAFGSMLGV